MRTPGPSTFLEYRRCLAVQRIDEGYSIEEVADFLGVSPSSVRRWVATFRQRGADGLAAQPVPGRPPKLTSTQEKIVAHGLRLVAVFVPRSAHRNTFVTVLIL